MPPRRDSLPENLAGADPAAARRHVLQHAAPAGHCHRHRPQRPSWPQTLLLCCSSQQKPPPRSSPTSGPRARTPRCHHPGDTDLAEVSVVGGVAGPGQGAPEGGAQVVESPGDDDVVVEGHQGGHDQHGDANACTGRGGDTPRTPGTGPGGMEGRWGPAQELRVLADVGWEGEEPRSHLSGAGSTSRR